MGKPIQKWVCGDCGGSHIQIQAWVDPNKNNAYLDEANDGECWCCDCDEMTKMIPELIAVLEEDRGLPVSESTTLLERAIITNISEMEHSRGVAFAIQVSLFDDKGALLGHVSVENDGYGGCNRYDVGSPDSLVQSFDNLPREAVSTLGIMEWTARNQQWQETLKIIRQEFPDDYEPEDGVIGASDLGDSLQVGLERWKDILKQSHTMPQE